MPAFFDFRGPPRLRKFFYAALLFCLAACAPATSSPTPTPVLPARLAVTLADAPTSPLYLPLSLAAALKYFDAEGVAVDLRYAPGGDLPAGALFGGQPVDYAVHNRQWLVVGAITRAPSVALLVRADLKGAIASLADLKGLRIGISAIGSHTHIVAAALLHKAGLSETDYTLVPVGTSTLGTAFEARSIDAGLGYEPYVSQLLSGGKASLLADLRTPLETDRWLGGGYPYTALLVDARAAAAYPATVQKVVNALARAQNYMRAHTPEEIAAVLPDTVTGRDKQQWVAAYRALRPAFALDPGSDAGSVNLVIEAVQRLGLIRPGEAIDALSVFDNRFADAAPKPSR